jgi:hypothetical protein
VTDPHRNRSFIAELFSFLAHEKRWWLLPLFLVVVLLAIIGAVANTGPLAPFIYPLI